jgi:hypothetical protein
MNFNTGDLILFSGRSTMSSIVEYVTQGTWSHVGMVVKDPDYLINTKSKKGCFLYESGEGETVDIDTGSTLFGIQLIDLSQYIAKYDGIVGYRKLTWNKTESDVDAAMRIIYNTTYHKKYDWNPYDLVDPAIHNRYWMIDKILGINTRRTDKFFCSALIAYVYTQLGLLKPNTEWSLIYPKFFGAIRTLEDGGCLGDIEILKT